MSDNNDLKTYLASISSVQMFPGVVVIERCGGALTCEVDRSANPSGRFFVGAAHIPQLLVRYKEAEARADALRKAHELFPEEDGWTNHNVSLSEIPRPMFIQMQLFTTAREIYHRILRLTGFRRAT